MEQKTAFHMKVGTLIPYLRRIFLLSTACFETFFAGWKWIRIWDGIMWEMSPSHTQVTLRLGVKQLLTLTKSQDKSVPWVWNALLSTLPGVGSLGGRLLDPGRGSSCLLKVMMMAMRLHVCTMWKGWDRKYILIWQVRLWRAQRGGARCRRFQTGLQLDVLTSSPHPHNNRTPFKCEMCE